MQWKVPSEHTIDNK
jgi:carbonic anhydrase